LNYAEIGFLVDRFLFFDSIIEKIQESGDRLYCLIPLWWSQYAESQDIRQVSARDLLLCPVKAEPAKDFRQIQKNLAIC